MMILPVVVLLIIAFVVVESATSTLTGSSCGGNCPGGDCATCPCGTTPNPQSISAWCAKYTGWNQANCQCIMQAESGGNLNANAVNQNSGGSYDIGLWQINTQNWNSCSGGQPPCDPNTNLNCAIDVYKWGGNTFRLWSTCSKCGCCSSDASDDKKATDDAKPTDDGKATDDGASPTDDAKPTDDSPTDDGGSSPTDDNGGGGGGGDDYRRKLLRVNKAAQ